MREASLRGSRVLVTGSAGVIGRELLVRLAERGATILSVDREPLPSRDAVDVEHLRMDLAEAPLDRLREFGPEVVFHLAAAFERSLEAPEFWEQNWHDNTVVSHRMADLAARTECVRAVVFASSYLVYRPSLYLFPEPRETPAFLKENDPIAPRNLCGGAKAYAESELDFVREVVRRDLRIVHARIFRSYGCGSRDVISRWVRAALASEPIDAFNPEGRFAYVFAGDVADGLRRLAECEEAAGPVNLALGRSRSVREVLDVVGRLAPGALDRVRSGESRGPYEASGADLSRLRRLTGWEPSTDLEEGIARVVEHEAARRRGGS